MCRFVEGLELSALLLVEGVGVLDLLIVGRDGDISGGRMLLAFEEAVRLDRVVDMVVDSTSRPCNDEEPTDRIDRCGETGARWASYPGVCALVDSAAVDGAAACEGFPSWLVLAVSVCAASVCVNCVDSSSS